MVQPEGKKSEGRNSHFPGGRVNLFVLFRPLTNYMRHTQNQKDNMLYTSIDLNVNLTPKHLPRNTRNKVVLNMSTL